MSCKSPFSICGQFCSGARLIVIYQGFIHKKHRPAAQSSNPTPGNFQRYALYPP
jgi:hypothetical protein